MGKSMWIWLVLSCVLWMVVILLPLFILPVCVPDLLLFLDENAKPHGCSRTLYWNTGVGAGGFVVTLLALKPSLRMVSALANVALGLLVILLPTAITGVCRMESMRCVWGTRPGLIAMGMFVMAVGAAGVILARKKA